MKKSEKLNIAMLAVVDSGYHASVKLEVIEALLAERTVAEFCEKTEEEK